MFPATTRCSLLVTCFSVVFAAKTQLCACCATRLDELRGKAG